MDIVRRDPDKGYIDSMLWLPKRRINELSVRSALTYDFVERKEQMTLQLWHESEHHLLVPRCFIDVREINYEVIDCRPTSYPKAHLQSKIILDAKNPHRTVQKQAVRALIKADGGILQLACVSGDTVLNLNRAGKGFRMTVQKAYERCNSSGRYRWRSDIPTKTRSFLGDRVGLHDILAIHKTGVRTTYNLQLVDGKSIRITPDHKVLTAHGYRSMDDGLAVGDLVAVDTGQVRWGKKDDPSKKKKIVYKRLHWYPNHPHAHKNGNKTGPRSGRVQEWCLEEHRAVAEADLNGLTLEEYRDRFHAGNVDGLKFLDPTLVHVHHKNGDHTDNRKENLEPLLIPEHVAHHSLGALAFHYGRLAFAEVTSIEQFGEEPVYDIACADPHHNFVANGIVVHNCGLGKTVVALHTITKLQTNAIIHIDNMPLLLQWKKEILLHLDIDEDDIGFIGDGVFDWQKPIVLATYQSIANKAHLVSEEFRRWFGQAWWDEGHHVGAPTYCRGADLYYGKRFLLTATPYRDDGQHVIYDMHIGPVLHKDLVQDLVPEIIFKWTGFTADEKDPEVFEQIGTIAGELHFAKLSAYMGSQPDRLQYIVDFVRDLVEEGRKVLVLSPSVAELSNLLCIWNNHGEMFCDIPVPTNEEVGFPDDIMPRKMTMAREEWIEDKLTKYFCPHAAPAQLELNLISDELEGDFLSTAIHNELERRRKKFVNHLAAQPSDAGLMIRKVNEATRATVVADKKVIFVVHKYGKEGLDAADVDTVVACEPISKKNATQQFMGRALRIKPGKKVPKIYVMVDSVGLLIGMSLKMQKVLRNWPCDEGGPFKYTRQGYPEKKMSISKVQALSRR